MKLLQCSGFPEIYAQLEEGWGESAMDICAFCYIQNLCGELVMNRYMVHQRREVESVCHGYMCILLYVLPLVPKW